MRLRKNPELAEKIKEYNDLVYINAKIDEDLAKKQIQLELGCGKGSFLTGMASIYSDKFFIGAETQIDIVYYAAVKARASECQNLRFIHGNVNYIEDWFSSDVQIDNLYINFCDPWPKVRHAKRRLVDRRFLKKYKEIIADNGSLKFKTDNKALFEFALEEFSFCNLKVVEQTNDLHNSQIENLVWTEYEQKFHRFGMPINFCHIVF